MDLSQFLRFTCFISLSVLLVVELTPPPYFATAESTLLIVFIMLTSITAKFSAVGGGVNDNNAPLISGSAGSGYISAPGLIAFINIAPVLVWLVGALQAVINGSCNEAMARQGEGCRDSTILFDAVGLVTCRIARVDMGEAERGAERLERSWRSEATAKATYRLPA